MARLLLFLIIPFKIEQGQRGEAIERLRTALREHEDAPRYVRRNNRRWARRAAALVREARQVAG